MCKELIVDLGGAEKVAQELGTTYGAVRNWMMPNRSIPWRYRPAVAKIAAERGIALPKTFWDITKSANAEKAA